MRKIILILALLVPFLVFGGSFVDSTSVKKTKHTKGDLGISLNVSAFSADWGFKPDATRDINAGIGFNYVFVDNFSFNVSINGGYQHQESSETSGGNLGFSAGVRYHPKLFLLGVTYNGGTNDFKTYSQSLRFDFGYTFFITKMFSIEPSLYYKKSIGNTSINRIGAAVGFGINF